MSANNSPIVHRDIKPANMLYMTDNDGYHFQLEDFGLTNEASKAPSIGVGTPLYTASEATGEITGDQSKADV